MMQSLFSTVSYALYDHLSVTSMWYKNKALCFLEKTFPPNIILAAITFTAKRNWQNKLVV